MALPSDTVRAWVDVDLDALVSNARVVAATSGTRLLPMVKANGYGLGAARVARALEDVDPWGYGVATVDEGAGLRSAGITRPILLVSPLTLDAIDAVLEYGFRPTIGDPDTLERWIARAKAPFHVEIDTGMGRAGICWDDAVALRSAGRLLASASGWEGVYTHFHSADSDSSTVAAQWGRFQAVLAALPRHPPLVHAANSAAALSGREYAADMVRPGIFLYGGRAGDRSVEPAPVAALRARVIAVRRVAPGESVSYGATWRAPGATTVATLGIGYADGLPRATSARSEIPRQVELRGRRVALVGRVTMDMCMVAVDDGEVAVGDVATIFGGLVSLDDQASASGTISYELLTSLGTRVARRYR